MHRRVVLLGVLCLFVSVDGNGFPTNPPCCPTPAPTCPPPPPPPIPCPPPPVYQPCPPPPVYEPPPPCPPPAAPPQPPPPPPPPTSENDCCHNCAEPCFYKTRKALASKTAQEGDVIRPLRNVNAKCNSEELRKIMRLGMFGDTRDSKRAIQHLAQETLGGKFSVICTTGEFSYIIQTNFFCQETHNDLTCYAFQSAKI